MLKNAVHLKAGSKGIFQKKMKHPERGCWKVGCANCAVFHTTDSTVRVPHDFIDLPRDVASGD